MKKIMRESNYETMVQSEPFGFNCMNSCFLNQGDFGHVTSSVLFNFEKCSMDIISLGYQRSYVFGSSPYGSTRVDSVVFETGFDFSERE